jgi:hypothetical protein
MQNCNRKIRIFNFQLPRQPLSYNILLFVRLKYCTNTCVCACMRRITATQHQRHHMCKTERKPFIKQMEAHSECTVYSSSLSARLSLYTFTSFRGFSLWIDRRTKRRSKKEIKTGEISFFYRKREKEISS